MTGQEIRRVIVGAVTALLALETTVRLDDWAQFGVPPFSPAVSMAELTVRDSLGLHQRPGTQYRQFRINRLGFRGGELPSDFRGRIVVTAGASETFGLYETPGLEWPRQLESLLRSECGEDVRVLNSAFAGMSLPTVEQDFVRRVSRLKPSVVIYYPTPMQYIEGDSVRAATPSFAAPAPLSPFRSRALPRFRDAFKRATPEPLLDLARRAVTARSRQATGAAPKEAVEAPRLERYLSDLERLLQTYRSAGSEPVIVVHRNRFSETSSPDAQRLLRAWERFYPRYTGQAIVDFDETAGRETLELGRRLGVTVVDPLSALRAQGDSAFADFSHFTDSGSRVVAEAARDGVRPLVCSR